MKAEKQKLNSSAFIVHHYATFCVSVQEHQSTNMVQVIQKMLHFLLLLFLVFMLATTTILAKSSSTDEDDTGLFWDSLRGAIMKHPGGYVHSSLGIFEPAPCGASRGLGWVNEPTPSEYILQIPLEFQMTRSLALKTLTLLIPTSVLVELPLDELDDAALLVLLLAHHRGLGPESSDFYPYLQSLPTHPNCGWSKGSIIPSTISNADVSNAHQYVERVTNGMAGDYAEYLSQTHWPLNWKQNPSKALAWSMCIINSRGTASATGVRLVPLLDLINHDHKAVGGFVELTENTDLLGAFVVRHQLAWKRGDEVLVNYQLDGYHAMDWFLSLGFVPSELLSDKANNEL